MGGKSWMMGSALRGGGEGWTVAQVALPWEGGGTSVGTSGKGMGGGTGAWDRRRQEPIGVVVGRGGWGWLVFGS